ncbi:MAG: tetratricopeptide repeat protein [Prolixibacteraceae bacterium]|nr:tetratricopeptide repeat protein [Prolixibacteraceae bacterium]MBN2648482.1 tetratricopeptide repeat protein [Prolixibacteraceae bacterium]
MNQQLNIAFNHFKNKQYAQAWDACLHVLKTNPQQADCLAMLGMMCNTAKRYSDAETYLRKCLFFHPQKHIIQTELATSLIYLKQFDEAEKLLHQSIGQNSSYQKTSIQLAKLYKLTGRLSESENTLTGLLEKNPKSLAALNNLGTLYIELNKHDEAISLFKKALALNPNMGTAHKNIGLIELKKGNIREAENSLLQAYKFLNSDTELILELIQLFAQQNKHQKAVALANHTLETAPDNTQLMMLAANSNMLLRKYEKAATQLKRVLQIEPDNTQAFYQLARCNADLCDWDNWENTREQFIETLETDIENIKPTNCSVYDTHYFNIPDWLQFKLMQKTATKYQNNKPALKFTHKNRQHQKIRIGYLSPDFREHALGTSVYQYFQHHNRQQFETYAFALFLPDKPDFVSQKIKADVDHFYDVSKQSDSEIAQFIYDNEIDILIDFGGYTTHTKPTILATKPAPVQIFMMGQPDTTALEQFDFFLADSLLIDQTNRQYYTENILYIPHGFVNSTIEPSEKKITKKELGIADDAFVFCSFCSPYKYDPHTFALWMKILEKVENSVLCILGNGNKTFENNIYSRVKSSGIETNRVLILPFIPVADHLNRLSICDLFLDTRYYTSCSSGAQALMMGVPVLTIKGESNAMRQGASVCHAANIDYTICKSTDEYYNKAVELAKNPLKIKQLKHHLTKNRYKLPLFDVKMHIENLEKSLLKIWNSYQNGEKFTDLHIDKK